MSTSPTSPFLRAPCTILALLHIVHGITQRPCVESKHEMCLARTKLRVSGNREETVVAPGFNNALAF